MASYCSSKQEFCIKNSFIRSLFSFQANIFMSIKGQIFFPLDEIEVKELRKHRLQEIEMWRILRDVFVYFMYFWILYVVCYTNTNTQTYQFQKSLSDSFVSSRLKESFTDVMIEYLLTLLKSKFFN